jgi:hypothetical protein
MEEIKNEIVSSQKIKIGYQEYTIEHRLNKIMEGKDECEGLYIPMEAKILIASSLVGDEKVQTIFHEILHAMSAIYHIDLSERQVDQIATAFVIMMRDNPNFLEKLFSQGGLDGREHSTGQSKAKRKSSNSGRVQRPKGTVGKK